MLSVIGSEPLENGMNIVGSHIDSPAFGHKAEPRLQTGGTTLLKRIITAA